MAILAACGPTERAVAAVRDSPRVSSRLLPGVFIGSHAIAEGLISRRQLRERSYRRLVQGVYADPSLPMDHRLRCAGVALLLPRGTAVGGHSAAGWYGAPFARPQDPVTVLRPADVLWKGPRGVRVHQTKLTEADIAVLDDVPVSAPLRTAWDVAALEPLATAVAAWDAMVRTGAVRVAQLTAMADSGAGRWGVARVRRAAALVDPRAESAPESRVRVALVLAGLEPVPQYEVREDGVLLGRVDLGWPDERVAVEYEGAYHFEGAQIVRDDARYERLIAAGWRVIRLSAADLQDLDAVVARVCEALGRSH
jgi:hypothetical protein